MAERFERLYKLPDNLYTNESPIIISAGVLLKDNDTGSVVVQLKFQSVSPKTINAVKISVSAYDVSGAEIQGVQDFQYLDINISNGQEFGSNRAIIMPSAVTRRIDIQSITVVFSDGTAWMNVNTYRRLPVAKTLEQHFGNSEITKQYKICTNDVATFVPSEEENLWRCSCGKWNKDAVCTHCRILKHKIFSALDIDALTKKTNNRIANETEQRHLAEEKQAKEKLLREAAQKAKNKKIAIATGVILAVVLVTLLFTKWILPDVIRPATLYNKAERLFEEGKYTEAIAAFEELGDYKDSLNRIDDVKTAILSEDYDYASSLLSEGKWEEALHAFTQLGEYSDSKARAEEARLAALEEKYAEAESLLSAGRYEEAYAGFEQIIDFRDAAERMGEAKGLLNKEQYESAESLLENGKMAEAAITFGKLIGYADAKERSLALWCSILPPETIASSNSASAAVLKNGTVVVTPYIGDWKFKDNHEEMSMTDAWTDVVSVSVDSFHTVGLKEDGTVLAAGLNTYKACDVSEWINIVQIATGTDCTIGLCADGTVRIASSEYKYRDATRWENICRVSTGENCIFGVKTDGTVVVVGHGDSCDRCAEVSTWTNIVAITADIGQAIGLKADGTVITTDPNLSAKVSSWSNIVAIGTCGTSSCVGLKEDGTIVVVAHSGSMLYKAESWNNVVAIASGYWHIIALKSNGTIVTTPFDNDNKKEYYDGQCEVSDWTNIKLPN